MDLIDRQSDTISRQLAIEAMEQAKEQYFDRRVIIGKMQDIVNNLPSSEPIRCKDCKHLFEDNKCPLRMWWTHTEDDFCSYAERRIE